MVKKDARYIYMCVCVCVCVCVNHVYSCLLYTSNVYLRIVAVVEEEGDAARHQEIRSNVSPPALQQQREHKAD